MKKMQFQVIDPMEHLQSTLYLLNLLNPDKTINSIEKLLREMSQLPSYKCFGLFRDKELIGISSGWTTIRIYCGKQLELDNVIIDSKIQSKGYGKFFMDAIKEWSYINDYQSISLNTYIENYRSHKFYFNQGYKILGYHFENTLSVQDS